MAVRRCPKPVSRWNGIGAFRRPALEESHLSDAATLVSRRADLLGPGTQLFYSHPVEIVRGDGVWLFDAEGRRYLDAYNNVAHVGHAHPRVVEALSRQASLLNTHTRYLHRTILDYVERLTSTFDAPLRSALLTCTGSEANDVALRMAQAATGQVGVIATDGTYHGNTAAVSQLSTRMPPIGGRASYVRLVRTPDSVRHDPATLAAAFADSVAEAIASLKAAGFGLSALIVCPHMENEGFPRLPHGFYDDAAKRVRDAGGLIIADEVQGGFGRSGSHFWSHAHIGLKPDIVTMGKPMGNGHPVAGVVTSLEIMTAFRKSFRYFNTFGGNPVSAAVATAVLDAIEADDLMANAARTGPLLLEQLAALKQRHPCIADVRGTGLFLGAELVTDRESLKPDGDLAGAVMDGMRERGVLMGKTGIHANVLKIRPPMPFSIENGTHLVSQLDEVLSEVGRGA